MGNRVALHNLGCKVNAYEIEAMQQLLEEAGYEIVPFEPGADIMYRPVVISWKKTKPLTLYLEITRRSILWRHWPNMRKTNRAMVPM